MPKTTMEALARLVAFLAKTNPNMVLFMSDKVVITAWQMNEILNRRGEIAEHVLDKILDDPKFRNLDKHAIKQAIFGR